MRQRINCDVAFHFVDVLGASKRIGAIDVHRATAAHAFAAGPAEGQGRIYLVLDLDQRVQDHRPALAQVDLEGVEARVFAAVGIPTVNLELSDPGGARRGGEGLAFFDLGIGRQREFNHPSCFPSVNYQ